MKKCKPEIHSLIIPHQLLSLLYRSLNIKQTEQSILPFLRNQEIFTSPHNQDLTGIRSYTAEEFFPSTETVWIISDIEECCYRKFNQVLTLAFF